MNAKDKNLNERGHHQGEFSQGVGGWAEYTVFMTETADTVRHDVTAPPGKVIPVIFLPGVMGSNLRLSKKRQAELERPDNRSWRPDDLSSAVGQASVVTATGFGGWYKDASPAQRQLNFDPNETEVEYYHYTESDGRFDPEGKETVDSDARHRNVPDDLFPIPPLMAKVSAKSRRTAMASKKKVATPAQVARWRGWSEVLFDGAYGTMLQTAERYLNNMFSKDGKVYPRWAPENLQMKDPKEFGASGGEKITEDELRKIHSCWYPVHAMGYNFIKSNGESAKNIADRIRGLVKGYQHRGFKCTEIIIVTHSMGGLVARALIHPNYGNLNESTGVKILGIYHSAMPAAGAACGYSRMRFGFKEKDDFASGQFAEVMAKDGEHATAILANAPAPLELMPASAYGEDWLKVVDATGAKLFSWPGSGQSAFDAIYSRSEKQWWRLFNPDWVNPGNVRLRKGGGVENAIKRIKAAHKFLDSIKDTFHPNTYASFSEAKERVTRDEVVFKVIQAGPHMFPKARDLDSLPHPSAWTLVDDDAKGILKVQAGKSLLTLRLEPGNAPGDETVPLNRSAKKVRGKSFSHGAKGGGYEHQMSYLDPQVLASMLYSMVKMAKSAKWD